MKTTHHEIQIKHPEDKEFSTFYRVSGIQAGKLEIKKHKVYKGMAFRFVEIQTETITKVIE